MRMKFRREDHSAIHRSAPISHPRAAARSRAIQKPSATRCLKRLGTLRKIALHLLLHVLDRSAEASSSSLGQTPRSSGALLAASATMRAPDAGPVCSSPGAARARDRRRAIPHAPAPPVRRPGRTTPAANRCTRAAACRRTDARLARCRCAARCRSDRRWPVPARPRANQADRHASLHVLPVLPLPSPPPLASSPAARDRPVRRAPKVSPPRAPFDRALTRGRFDGLAVAAGDDQVDQELGFPGQHPDFVECASRRATDVRDLTPANAESSKRCSNWLRCRSLSLRKSRSIGLANASAFIRRASVPPPDRAVVVRSARLPAPCP